MYLGQTGRSLVGAGSFGSLEVNEGIAWVDPIFWKREEALIMNVALGLIGVKGRLCTSLKKNQQQNHDNIYSLP